MQEHSHKEEKVADGPVATAQSEGLVAGRQTRTYDTGPKLWLLVFAVTLTTFLVLLDIAVIVTATPQITTDFNSLEDIGWYASAYNICIATLQPLSGKLYSLLRTKWLFLGFFLVFEIGNALCGSAQSSTMLILGRAVSGIGGAGMQIGGLTIITAASPLEKRPMLLGLWLGGAQLGVVTGPVIGGALTQYATWRWCFYINIPIGAIAALMLILIDFPDHSVRPPGTFWKGVLPVLDLPGFAIFSPSAVLILLALQFGEHEYGWRSSIVIGCLCGGAVGLVLFAFWEKRAGENAMIPLSLISKRVVWTSLIANGALFTTIYTTSYWFSVYFQTVREAEPLKAGINILPSVLTSTIFAAVGGAAIGRVGYYMPFGIAGAAFVLLGHGLTTMFTPHTSTAKWAGYQILFGFGRGLAMQVGFLASQTAIKAELTTIANGLFLFAQNFGAAIFMTVASVIFTADVRKELEKRFPELDAQLIIDAGGRGIANVVPKASIPEILDVYNHGVVSVFYLLVALSAVMLAASFGMGWVDVRQKKGDENPADGEEIQSTSSGP